MSEDGIYLSKKELVTEKECYNIKGLVTENSYHVVCKIVKNDLSTKFYIRVENNEPVLPGKFDAKNSTLNPEFRMVDKTSFSDYLEFLQTRKEGILFNLKNHMKTKGYI